jgi:hypothetical protein
MMNRCEAEINAIRLRLYEETKDLTPDERSRQRNDRLKELAAEFGFTISKPASEAKAKTESSFPHTS